MFNSEQFVTLSQHLNNISHVVPYKWGREQIKALDRKLPKLFEYDTYPELNAAIEQNIAKTFIEDTQDIRNYYWHRWFMYKCSTVDEYLLQTTPGINLDAKGTIVFKPYKGDAEFIYKNPLAIIDLYYKEQSRDFHYRRKLQNRLFVVHHSYAEPQRETYVRTLFDVKAEIFSKYIEMRADPNHKVFDYMNGRKADLILLVEMADGKIAYGFASENLKGELIMRIFE
jgi:hypothetical protein